MQARIPEVTLLEEVGRGPGSVVFRALHRGAGCTVKLPSERLPSFAAQSTTFEQDMLQLARLAPAGMPRVLQLGATGDTPYAILDQAQGEPLSAMLRRAFSEAGVVTLARTLTTCLQRLHEAGFVHGALNADHVLVSERGERVTLLDTGSIARPIPFDPRSDTRALGFLLHDCLVQVQGAASATRVALTRLSEELASGKRTELPAVVAELESHSDLGTKRRSSYPPPSRESLAVSSSVPTARRARSEIVALRRYWDQASEHGGKLIEVLGPAGSGKSRLLAVFAELVGEEQVQVLSVKCRDSDWAPFSTLKRLLEGHLAGLALLEPERRAHIEESLRLAAGPMASRIRLLSPRLAALFQDSNVTIAEGDAQQVFVAGMAEFLAKYLESSGPSVLVIDDIHWLDASSRMVLSRLAARLCSQGHLLVCAARDDADSREPLERFRSTLVPDLSEVIQLGPLSETDASELIADYLGLDRRPERDLVQQLTQLSDGTPLSLLELLRLTLERGHLRPRWGRWHLDAGPVQRMRLPASSQALIRHRLSALDITTLEVLRTAAVIRSRIDPPWLARVNGMALPAVRDALEVARAARLIEKDARGEHCFVHDCVWEELLRSVPEERRRALHERAAEALYDAEGRGADYEYELARHHAAGLVALNPRRAFEATRRAARRALEACDDPLTLSFLKPAETAARLAGIDPDRQFYVELAEASWRTGASRESYLYFERALERSAPGIERAHVLGRLAWIYHYNSNADACWKMLSAALDECGRSVPDDDPRGLLVDAGSWLRSAIPVRRRKLPREEAETLCGLYIDCMRVSFESGHPARGLSSTLRLAQLARELEPCRTRVHADMLTAFVASTLGATRAADMLCERADAMSRDLADPIAQTLCHQVRHVILGWRGNLDECEREARLSVDERGHFMELGELCHMCFGMYGVEAVRGRPSIALAWLDRAIERVRQTGHAPAVFSLIEDAACSALFALGREKDIARLKRTLQFVECAGIQPGSYFHVLGYQSRVQYFTERGNLGEEFEALVDEFDRLGQNPKQVHALVHCYYIHVGHARVHQCLRAEPGRRALLLPKLERAMNDLDAATRVNAALAHQRFVRAAHAWFSGDRIRAEALLVEADQLANEYAVVWVNYAVARLRAHILRANGKHEAATNHAQTAALYARRYGQHNRLRFIREEFELSEAAEPTRSEIDAPYTRRHLAALLRISQANSRELGPERQARLILDELLEALGAERALLFMRGEASGSFALTAARGVGGCDLELNAEYEQTLVEQAYVSGQTQLADTNHLVTDANRTCVVVALVLREQAVGALYLDRAEDAGGFKPEDAALLQALANQVPVALELASALRERERLQQNLRQAQKMEAIGRLAGGIAHDFNNILAAIQFAADSLATIVTSDEEGHDELSDIQASARRGTELTRQLLTFSRGKTVPPRRIILGEIVRELIPMLRRLVRADVRLEVELPDVQLPTLADPSHIERVLMNLCQNASDAMPGGGTITVRVSETELRPSPSPAVELRNDDGYVLLTVADSGTGMSEEVRTRLFEPFFTTKSGGTGLGLANVYAIVQQCGGQIEVASDPGQGSTFRIFLPRVETVDDLLLADLQDARLPIVDEEDLGGGTVLVVDDDDTLRRMMVRTLEAAGYQVLSAQDGPDALNLVDALDGLLDLAVTDLHMPDMDGVQLADALLARDPDVKLLFVSGAEPDETQLQELRDRNGAFLAKPFDEFVLLDKVGVMLRIPPGAIQGH
jgi:signal transduction histidine kinase/CheY-like chemotaxis protein/ABC-type cobalamin transport system ATPase subunit